MPPKEKWQKHKNKWNNGHKIKEKNMEQMPKNTL